jgi:hypothetical protein
LIVQNGHELDKWTLNGTVSTANVPFYGPASQRNSVREALSHDPTSRKKEAAEGMAAEGFTNGKEGAE